MRLVLLEPWVADKIKIQPNCATFDGVRILYLMTSSRLQTSLSGNARVICTVFILFGAYLAVTVGATDLLSNCSWG